MNTETTNDQAYLRMARMLARAPGLSALALLFLGLELASSLSGPWILGRAVDALESASGGELGSVAARHAALFLAATVLMNLSRFFHGDFRGRMVQGITAGLREEALRKLHALSPAYYGAQDTGGVLARVSRDIEKMRPFFGQILFTGLRLGLVVAGSFAVIAWSSPLLASVSLACFAVSMRITLGTARRLGPLNRKADDDYDSVSLDIKENIEGVRVVKSFGREPRQAERFRARIGRYLDSSISVSDCWSLRMPLANAALAQSIPLTLVIGGGMMLRGELAKGTVVAAVFYAARLFHEMGGLIRLVGMTQEAAVSGVRLFELLDSPSLVPVDLAPRPLPKGRGALAFEGVSFAYPDAREKSVLRDLAFAVSAGERVAVVGPTGGGKSTMLSLILRFFDPSAGRILLDGADIRRLPLRELRRAVGCVFQETFLFSESLRGNLAYARPGTPDSEILKALETAQLGPFLGTLPNGLDTLVGERGVTLSGGQKQRVAIARTLLANPRLLILDDAMASVDARTERSLVRALDAASAGRTTLIITQRLSGVLLANRAVVVDAGRVVDSGTHDELFGRCGAYRALFEGQVLETAAKPPERKNDERQRLAA